MVKKTRIISLLLSCVILFTSFGCRKEEEKKVSYDGRVYDLSLNGDESITAKTVKVGTKYTLTLSGGGEGIDFEKKESVPWNPIIKSIDKVIIEEGVTKIGNYYFYSSSVDEFYLPSSLKAISDFAFNGSQVLYSYSSEIETNVLSKIYYYSETNPGISNKYFHIVEGVPAIWSNYKVLFVGNSFTYYASTPENPMVPKLFKELALSLGESVEVDFVVKGSHTLTGFSNPDDEMGKILYEKLTNNDDYTHIILQEQSTTPINSYNNFETAVGVITLMSILTQKDCKVILYETWGSPAGIQSTGHKTVGDMERTLREAYEKCAQTNNSTVDYVGKAFTYVYEKLGINVYYDDNRHQNNVGAYLSACVHVASILKIDIRESSFSSDIDSELAKTLREVAHNIAFNLPLDDDASLNTPEQDEDHLIVIAWYQKEATSGLNDEIIARFESKLKAFLLSLNYSKDEVDSILLRGYSGNVAPSCEAIKKDGDVDLMIGWKSNVDTTGNLSFLESYPKTSEDEGLQMGAQSGRWIHRLTDTDLSKTIFDWIVSNKDGLFE